MGLSGRATASPGDAEPTSETLADRHKVIVGHRNPEIGPKLRCPPH